MLSSGPKNYRRFSLGHGLLVSFVLHAAVWGGVCYWSSQRIEMPDFGDGGSGLTYFGVIGGSGTPLGSDGAEVATGEGAGGDARIDSPWTEVALAPSATHVARSATSETAAHVTDAVVPMETPVEPSVELTPADDSARLRREADPPLPHESFPAVPTRTPRISAAYHPAAAAEVIAAVGAGAGNGPGVAAAKIAGAGTGNGLGTGVGDSGDPGSGSGLSRQGRIGGGGKGSGFGSGGSLPGFINNVQPRYPEAARQNGWQGTVRLRLHVAEDGRVASAELVSSSGYAVLDDAALAAVRHWRGSPARQGGRPVAMDVILPVRFRLE